LSVNRDSLQRYAIAVVSHLLLVAAWYFFVELGKVPKFVMPSPQATLNALLVPNYRWLGEYRCHGGGNLRRLHSRRCHRIGIALLFSWFRWLELIVMPLLVSLNMIPKVRARATDHRVVSSTASARTS